MSRPSDLELEVRAMLADVADHAEPPGGLADRLIANAPRSGAGARRRALFRGGRGLPALLAAAAVVVAVVVGLLIRDAASSTQRAPAVSPPAPSYAPSAPVTPLPQSTPSQAARPESAKPGATSRTPAGASRAPHRSQAELPVPAGFAAFSVSFVDHTVGYALGNAPCSATPHYCATLARTTDGGAHWSKRPLPPGLTPVDDQGNPHGGSCSNNGDVYGPCVDHVLFADQRHGYLWGFRSFYRTVDGGATWIDEHSRARDVVTAGHSVLRLRVLRDCSSPCEYALERSRPGSTNWTPITLPGKPAMDNAQLVSGGGELYLSLLSFTGGEPTNPHVYRSSDGGVSWHELAEPCPGDAVLISAAPDGALVAQCTGARTVRVLRGGSDSWGPVRAGPRAAGGTGGEIVVARSATELLWYQRSPGTRFHSAWSGFRSDDGGGHWSKIGTDAQPLAFSTGSFGFAPTATGTKLAVTTDGGRTVQTHPFS